MLVYTFRTNPFLPFLEKEFPKIVVLAKLKDDMKRLESLLLEETPKLVVGFALGNKETVAELRAVNRFNKSKTVIINGQAELALSRPHSTLSQIAISTYGGDSFCNWAMYRVANHLLQECLPTKHLFFHALEKDMPVLCRGLARCFCKA